MAEMFHDLKTDAEIDREIAQSDQLADSLIRQFVGLPASMVVAALARIYAHAIHRTATDKDLGSNMRLFGQAVAIELAALRAKKD